MLMIFPHQQMAFRNSAMEITIDNFLAVVVLKVFIIVLLLSCTISIDCNTENVIYPIAWNKAYLQYVGETMT